MDDKAASDVSQLEYGPHGDKPLKIDGDVLLVTGSEVQRVPVASSDPNDPLNYAKWRKMGVLITTCWFCMLSIMVTSVC